MNTTAPQKITVIPVSPIGTDTSFAFVDYADRTGGVREVSVPRYPESPNGEALRKLRIDKRITMRDAAVIVGINAHDYCGIESGRLQLSESDWALLRGMIADAKGRASWANNG